ncbi:unnamed protein product, partial [Phaeothamnion confervicola]
MATPSLLHCRPSNDAQWSDYMFNFLFLREALPSPYALQALYPMFDVCDDGVAVDFHEDFLCCMPKAPSPAPPAAPAASPQSPLPPLCASPSQSSLPSPLPSVSPLLPALHAASHRKIVDVRFIIVPGALVSPLAYAPVARALAGKGYPTYIARLPFNLELWRPSWSRPPPVAEMAKKQAAAQQATGA